MLTFRLDNLYPAWMEGRPLPGPGHVSRLLNAAERPAASSASDEVNPYHEDTRDAFYVGGESMRGPVFLLKKRKLEEALSLIKTSSEDLAEKRRACLAPVQLIKDNLAALPVFVFICNI